VGSNRDGVKAFHLRLAAAFAGMTRRRERRQGRIGTLIARLGGTLRYGTAGLTRFLWPGFGQDRYVGPRRRLDGELEEPVEEQAPA